MIKIEANTDKLLVKYYPNSGIQWILKYFQSKEILCVKKTFYVSKAEIDTLSEVGIPFVSFKIADIISIEGEAFYHFDRKTLGITFDLYISTKCHVSEKWFIGERQTSVFKIIDKFWKHGELFIGCNGEYALSETDFRKTVRSLPNHTELDKYVQARICNTMKNFITSVQDASALFQAYMNKKQLDAKNLSEIDFQEFDIIRYTHLAKKLENMLSQSETAYNESDWQKLIMKFIQVLFPKYVVIEQHPKIKTRKSDKKIPDIILGDINGYVDIIEIKKPFEKGILTAKNSSRYRDNYIPLHELSGAVMQCEKYIFYMTTGGEKVQKELNGQYKTVLPTDYELKIVNPKALIIMGRSDDFNEQQKEDFEIIKRKYRNIIDIITYDDLLYRLKRTIELLKQKKKEI